MIKVAVAGADTPLAGELLRILVNHSEVDIIGAQAPRHPGIPAKSIHHGLIGETPVPMVDRLDFTKADILFVCEPMPVESLNSIAEKNDIKIVDAANHNTVDHSGFNFIYGLSEINRKPMVRGAKMAYIPLSTSSVTLISLFPLASHLLLNSPIKATVNGNTSFSECPALLQESAQDVAENLMDVQKSFIYPVVLNQGKPEKRRGIRITMEVKCQLRLEDVMKLYEDIYDDHNFTFISASPADYREVEGTNKCVISLSKPDADTLCIDTVADATMRGGAGEAVHVMNLLFGLHEKTGLALKATSALPY